MEARLAQAERNLADHARIFSEHTRWMRQREIDEARREEVDKATKDWRDRLEKKVEAIYSMGRWGGGAVALLIITAVMNLVLK